jgi:SAM-dependent methyltransferase
MAFEDLMGKLTEWTVATEALAALGAQLALAVEGKTAPPEIDAALRAVSTAAGVGDLDEIPVPQRAMALGLVRTYLREANDLVDDPAREPGWRFTDPAILDGWGRASMSVPPMIKGLHPDLADISSFLDVGTGVGLLAVAATNVWPSAAVVGIDPWAPSLERARANVAGAGLDDRITLREQGLGDLGDVDTYDCVWIPSFFLPEDAIEKGLPAAVRALRPGGWLVVGRMRTRPEPLPAATNALHTLRSGGSDLDAARAEALVEAAGCVDVTTVAPGGVPLELVLGRRPA